MFKLVVLFSVVALAAANPSGWLGHGAVVPGVTSVSAYDTKIVHPSPVYHHPAPLVVGHVVAPAPLYHHLGKRSLGYATPAIYSPWVGGYGIGTGYGYGARYAAPWYGLGYGAAYPRALSVHPY